MDTKTFEAFLLDLQKSETGWPNKVFAWLQSNYKLFMVATASGRPYELLTYQFDVGPDAYRSHRYGIDPRITYLKFGAKQERYCPVEALVSKVSEFTFLGQWTDSSKKVADITPAMALRRWDEAKSHIPGCEQILKHMPLNEPIRAAANLAPEHGIEAAVYHSHNSKVGA